MTVIYSWTRQELWHPYVIVQLGPDRYAEIIDQPTKVTVRLGPGPVGPTGTSGRFGLQAVDRVIVLPREDVPELPRLSDDLVSWLAEVILSAPGD